MSNSSHSSEAFGDAPNNFYDAEFSVDINKKMRVPNKIKLAPNNVSSDVLEDPAIIAVKKVNENSEWMRVPERIWVVGEFAILGLFINVLTDYILGGEAHLTTREPPPELKLESTFIAKQELVQLTTPPRTLRIEDTAPVFETPLNQLDKALKSVENKPLNKSLLDIRMNDSLM